MENQLKKTVDRIAKMLRSQGIEPFEGDAHAFLVWVYKHPAIDLLLRKDAAVAAIAFEKPRLASTQISTPPGKPLQVESVGDLELARRLVFILDAAVRHGAPK